MLYLVSQVLLILLIATVLGFLIGWILRKIKASRIEEKLNTRLQQSEHSITPIKTALTQVQNEVEARDRSLAKLQSKYDDLKSEVPPAQAEIVKLSAKIGESDASIQHLNRALNDKDGQLARFNTDLGQERAALRQTDLALTEAQGKRSALESRLAEMKTRLDNNQAASERAKAERSNLQRDINNLQMQLNDSKHKNEADVATLKNSLKLENMELQKSKEALKEAKASADNAAVKIDELKEQLNKKDTECKLADKELSALKREIEALLAQQKTLQSAHDANTVKLENALAERLRLTEQKTEAHSSSSAEMSKLESEIARLRDELGKGEKQQAAFQISKDAAEAKLAEHTAAMAGSEKERQRLERKLAIVEAQLENQQAEAQKTANDLEKQLAASNAAKDASDSQRVQLEQSIQKLKEDLNNKITDSKIAVNQRDMLEADISVLEEEVRSLDADARALRTELQRSNDKHKDTIEKLRVALAEKEAQSSDGGAVRKQLTDLQSAHKALERDHLNALKKADQKITDLDRALDRTENKVKAAHDKATEAARATESSLKDDIADLKKQLSASEGELKLANRDDKRNQNEIAELKITIKGLNDRIAELSRELSKQEAIATKEADKAQNSAAQNKQLEASLAEARKTLASANSAAAAAEKQLHVLQASANDRDNADQRLSDLDKLLAVAVADKKSLALELKKSETEAERLRTDAKLSAAEKRELEKEAAKLSRARKNLESEKKAKARLQQQAEGMQKQLDELTYAEADYLNKIHELELQIVVTRKDNGNNMLSRIRELESMLSAEKRKVDSLQQPISIVSESVGVSSSVVTKRAANSSSSRKKKKAS